MKEDREDREELVDVEDAEVLAEFDGEQPTDTIEASVVRIGEDYYLVEDDRVLDNAREVKSIARHEARRIMLAWGEEPAEIAEKTARRN